MADPDNGLRPMAPARIAALLTSCLALVRPAGMSEADAEAWLTVATGELRDMPADLVEEGCGHARRSCTHHGQILPAIVRLADERWQERRRRRFAMIEARKPKAEPQQDERWIPEPGELDRIKRETARKLRANGGR